MSEIQRLLNIMARLRDPDSGCAWDLKQTFSTIAPYTIEEAYEVADAIERDQPVELCDELGDLLLQVVFHARIAEEAKLFDFADVVNAISEKLLRRHPHIFAEQRDLSQEQVRELWENQKALERASKKNETKASALDGVAVNLPALTRAEKIQKRAQRVGFDWSTLPPVLDKVEEELAEVQQAHAEGNQQNTADEIGDLLFAVVNLSRHLNVDPEGALRGATAKFYSRFTQLERIADDRDLDLSQMSIEEMDRLWDEVKVMSASE